jgi:thymidine kinase
MAGSMELYADCGYLEIIKGPMFSGKTTRLLDIYKKFSFCEIKTMVINYEKDNRYSDILLSSHDKVMIPCIKALKLSDIIQFTDDKIDCTINTKYYEDFMRAKAILINEGQFFTDIVEWVTIAVEKYHKNVYICGLNSDFKRSKFGNWLDLEAMSDNIVMLHSFCSHCKRRPAIFSHRLSNEEELEVIGADSYIPVCRKCYNMLINMPRLLPKKDTIEKDNYILGSSNIHYYPLKNVNY